MKEVQLAKEVITNYCTHLLKRNQGSEVKVLQET